MPAHASEDSSTDPVALVARIAELLPGLDSDQIEHLAGALDDLTEAVGLRLDLDRES